MNTLKLVLLVGSALIAFGAIAQQSQRNQNLKAPELVGSTWINAAADKAPTLASRKGKVTVVHFWTFACSNCKANLPAYGRIYAKFKAQGVEVIGVHTPELEIEKSTANVKDAVAKYGIKYPVLVDTDARNWNNWRQQMWPTVFVIDADGYATFRWEGELAWRGANGEQQLDRAIKAALNVKR
ncbi:MAG: redoxin domain-containing protein [Armatimonadetes bacterium]|nr:redoxin domain-containing protein [Armatimonadota bacterium]